ncbi:MAG: type II toxin-antitoxin system HicA family toxin [Rubrimonas sp.]|uniref:type II toxin-antitoxin system HicA family toxin n=1 Tax=Rubrimonas sp. TaxID=2036015 RepID=UPI002FDE6FB7
MNGKHRRTLAAIFSEPVPSGLKWDDIEALLMAAGCERSEGRGSRVRFTREGVTLFAHRPHPSPETKRYLVREVRAFLEQCGIRP